MSLHKAKIQRSGEQSVARDARDDRRDALAIRMAKGAQGNPAHPEPLTDAEWDQLTNFSDNPDGSGPA
jgi:hypothetical protein